MGGGTVTIGILAPTPSRSRTPHLFCLDIFTSIFIEKWSQSQETTLEKCSLIRYCATCNICIRVHCNKLMDTLITSPLNKGKGMPTFEDISKAIAWAKKIPPKQLGATVKARMASILVFHLILISSNLLLINIFPKVAVRGL